MKKILSIIFSFLLAVMPASSMPPNIWIPEKERIQLQLWLTRIGQKLKKLKRFDEIKKAIGEKPILCTCTIDIKGNISDLKVVSHTVLTAEDKLALKLVRSISPLPAPPNQLPVQKGLVISFSALSQTPEVSLIPFKSWGPNRFL